MKSVNPGTPETRVAEPRLSPALVQKYSCEFRISEVLEGQGGRAGFGGKMTRIRKEHVWGAEGPHRRIKVTLSLASRPLIWPPPPPTNFSTMSAADQAAAFKAKGNEFFKAKDYTTAIEWYTKAVDADPQNRVYYSNRSAAHAALRNYEAAAKDGEMCQV